MIPHFISLAALWIASVISLPSVIFIYFSFSKLEELILGTMYSRDVTPFKKNNFFFPTRKIIFWVQESSIFLGSEISSLVFRSMLPESTPERQEEGVGPAVVLLPQVRVSLRTFLSRAHQVPLRKGFHQPNMPSCVLAAGGGKQK